MTTTKARVKAIRTYRVLERLDQPGKAALIDITVGKLSTAYFVERLETGWGQGFKLTKAFDGSPTSERQVYDVMLAEDGSRCECLGFLKHGHCKHPDALRAAISDGSL